MLFMLLGDNKRLDEGNAMTYNQTAQHSTAQHSTAQHSTAQHSTR
ncbi:adenine methyltransferase [Lactococcus garvieae]|nr:adenine methyltransferase [Lactococcus garvieae]